MPIERTVDIQLNVKPVFICLYHDYVYEGPCRFGSGEELEKKYDLMYNQEAYQLFLKNIKTHLEGKVNLLEPVFVARNEEFQIKEDLLKKITEDMDKTDVYLFGQGGRVYDIVVEFAQRFKKPIMFSEPPNPFFTAITASAIIARGLETYPTLDWDDIIKYMKVLRVRKVLKETRALLASKGNSNISFSTTDSFICLEDVTKKLGVRFRYVDIHELLDQIHFISPPNSNYTLPGRIGLNPTEEDMEHIKEITDKLIAGSLECHMGREDVFNSVKAYYTVKKMLAHHDCNAFSIPCPDICATRRMNEEKITFCLIHSLLNEEGIPSACEYDIPALLAMVILMNFSNAAPYMGNTFPVPLKNGKRLNVSPRYFRAKESQSTDIYDLSDKENVMLTFHAVPNRKLRGLEENILPYSIRPYTRDGNWGATIRYDFKQDKDQTITMCRIDPSCTKLFVARGTIVGGIGYNDKNCSEGVFFTVNDYRDFFKKQVIFGNHIPLVYGDYFDEIVTLGEVLGLEVITA